MDYLKENLIDHREDYRSIYQKIQKSSIPEREKLEKYINLVERIRSNYFENIDLWNEIKFEI